MKIEYNNSSNNNIILQNKKIRAKKNILYINLNHNLKCIMRLCNRDSMIGLFAR